MPASLLHQYWICTLSFYAKYTNFSHFTDAHATCSDVTITTTLSDNVLMRPYSIAQFCVNTIIYPHGMRMFA